VRGIELGFSGNVTPKWNIFGGYTYMPSKVTNAGITKTTTVVGTTTYVAYAAAAAEGKPFPNTPEHSFTLFTNYKVTPKFTLGGGRSTWARSMAVSRTRARPMPMVRSRC
jgi:catecholate siderophore receptor